MSQPHAGTLVQFRSGRRGVPASRSFEKWVDAALAGSRRSGQVNIVLFGTAEARGLNRKFRGKDYATNVLSFPYEAPAKRSNTPRLLGDVVICPAVVRREAAAQCKPVRDHFAHLTVHGVLHLLGHDHENAGDAERMETLERRILHKLGIPDPYETR